MIPPQLSLDPNSDISLRFSNDIKISESRKEVLGISFRIPVISIVLSFSRTKVLPTASDVPKIATASLSVITAVFGAEIDTLLLPSNKGNVKILKKSSSANMTSFLYLDTVPFFSTSITKPYLSMILATFSAYGYSSRNTFAKAGGTLAE